MHDFRKDSRFADLSPLSSRALLSSPTMHGEEMEYMREAYDSNWMTTMGENINEIERLTADFTNMPYAVALSCGTAALHLAVKLAAEVLYGSSTGISTPSGRGYGGALLGKKIFCSDLTFGATVNPVVYEGGEPVFIDSEYETWNMDPESLEKAFKLYPDVRLVVFVHLYGMPGKIREIKEICERHNALLIEDAAESLGASIGGKQTGSYGDYGVLSFNGNKIITGSAGGVLLTRDEYSANKARKWSTQSREAAPWYEHEELGYNYRISNVIAGVIRGQWNYIEKHLAQKQGIYRRYRDAFLGMPMKMNPDGTSMDDSRTGGGVADGQEIRSNYWLSCVLIDREAMCESTRSERMAIYLTVPGKTCPTEILEAMAAFNAEGRPIWKPMHMQPFFMSNVFVTQNGNGRARTNAYISGGEEISVSTDIFERGLCLPSDIKMTESQQDTVIEIIKRCFR